MSYRLPTVGHLDETNYLEVLGIQHTAITGRVPKLQTSKETLKWINFFIFLIIGIASFLCKLIERR